ncbi:hypothetical protein GH733_013046 [Mirounga leonina]|nr:hypothetical protein GH733_013046 [Mirounga leonina]
MYPNTRKQSKWLSFSEDGLYLTVYRQRAPADALLRLSIHLPARRPAQPLHRPAQASAFHARVMVWFPGGAFLVGSASTYDASELAAREKVTRRNWALLDQVAAQPWVQKNHRSLRWRPRLRNPVWPVFVGHVYLGTGPQSMSASSTAQMHVQMCVYRTMQVHRPALTPAKGTTLARVEEKALSLQMMKYRANFAHTGNPNVGKLTYWPQYNKEEKYLWMDFTVRVGVKLKEEKMAFRMRLHQHGGPEKQRHF